MEMEDAKSTVSERGTPVGLYIELQPCITYWRLYCTIVRYRPTIVVEVLNDAVLVTQHIKYKHCYAN